MTLAMVYSRILLFLKTLTRVTQTPSVQHRWAEQGILVFHNKKKNERKGKADEIPNTLWHQSTSVKGNFGTQEVEVRFLQRSNIHSCFTDTFK